MPDPGRKRLSLGSVIIELVTAVGGVAAVGATLWVFMIGPLWKASTTHYAPDPSPIQEVEDTPRPAPPDLADLPAAPGLWTCDYAPTMNYDWHDDVLCTNGTDQERPYLLSDDSYVTQGELMNAATEYESRLNGG